MFPFPLLVHFQSPPSHRITFLFTTSNVCFTKLYLHTLEEQVEDFEVLIDTEFRSFVLFLFWLQFSTLFARPFMF